jgi:hypothetical protein
MKGVRVEHWSRVKGDEKRSRCGGRNEVRSNTGATGKKVGVERMMCEKKGGGE